MTNEQYLNEVLTLQRLDDDSDEMQELQSHRADVEALLRSAFEKSSPSIRYGGSKAKGTLIREDYDLDIICYFPSTDTIAGDSLEDIYNNVHQCLDKTYYVTRKNSSLRLQSKDPKVLGADFHIDVVPGRYTDDTKGDCFIHQAMADKKRMKTNLQIHIDHIRNSEVVSAIRLLKLWKARRSLTIKQFAWELLVIKLLEERKTQTLEEQLAHVWRTLRDADHPVSIEDPANPNGNNLNSLLESVRNELSGAADSTLRTIENVGWKGIFGELDATTASEKVSLLESAAVVTASRTRPWFKKLDGETMA